jgi:hypothetical protein
MEALLALDLKDYFRPYAREIYRLVENQSFSTTRRLVDSNEEHDILEDMLEASKPVAPKKNARGILHYLLFTPFRYPPLKGGRRFHTLAEQSIFYGAEELNTAMAEVAYRRFLFAQHSKAALDSMLVDYDHFVARVKSSKAILLTEKPFQDHRDKISHPATYAHSQPLGKAMRKAGVEVFNFFSARTKQGVNVGLFTPEAFQKNQPSPEKTRGWSVYVSAETVEFKRAHIRDNKKESHIFTIQDFYVGKKFPVI